MVVALSCILRNAAHRLLRARVRASSAGMGLGAIATSWGSRQRVLAVLAGIWACWAGAGCGQQPAPLRIGVDTWPAYRLLGLAQEKGFFREEGADVQLLEFGCLSDTRRAYETGKLDGLAITAVEVLVARDASDRSPMIARVLDFSEGSDVILAPKDIRSVRDLRGKQVGVELASLGVYMLARALAIEGMTLADIRPVSKDPATMREELLSGQLDAVVTYPPESDAVIRDPRFHVIFSSRQIPGEIVDVIAFDEAVLRERPGQVRAFQRGLDRALTLLHEDPAEAYRTIARRYGTTPEEAKASFETGLRLFGAGEWRPYMGERGQLRPLVEAIADSLRREHLLGGKPGVTDCIASP